MKLLRRLIAFVRSLVFTRSTQRYRPELHYMRGPGPRSLAKSGAHSGRET
jgi:hypothetical protein